jgi:integrase
MAAKTTAPAVAELDLADLVRSWVTHLESERKAPGTIRAYAGAAAAFITWHQAQAPGMPVTASSLDRKAATAFLADVLCAGAAPATARARHAALRQFSAWLAAEGETDTDPLLGLKPPKPDKSRVDSLDAAELAALVKACRVPLGADRWTQFECLRDEAVIRLLADTGMRAGELLALTVSDVDLRRRLATLTRTNGGKHRIAAFSPEAALAVDRYLRKARRGHKLAPTPALWLGTANRGWTYHALRGSLLKRAEAAGINGFHAHRLRHTAALAALDAGLAEGDVMAAMGWSSRAMLDRYVEDTAQQRAAENFRRYLDEKAR